MKNIILATALLAASFSTVNCGSSSSSNSDPSQELFAQSRDACKTRSAEAAGWTNYICYSYTGSVNGQGCTTGQREFPSQSAYCTGLKDDALNKNCARSQRDEAFTKSCQ